MPVTPTVHDEGSGPRRSGLRYWVALALLLVVAGVCASLGSWQLNRAVERDTLHQRIEAGRRQAPMSLTAHSSVDQLIPWRAAVSRGTWSNSHTVLLENRNLDGRPGYWVATPLLFDNGADGTSPGASARPAGVLVLRGWLPRDMNTPGALPAIPEQSGVVEIRGELHSHVPRIFELWKWAGGRSTQLPDHFGTMHGGSSPVPQVQNLDLAEYERASGLRLLPVVLAQTAPDTLLTPEPASVHSVADALHREWPGPSLDSDQNRGYALQWFSFAAIALIAALFLIRAMYRNGRQGRSEARKFQ